MKGFDLRKVLPWKAFVLLALGAAVWCVVLGWVGPRSALYATWKGLQAFGVVIVLSAAAQAFRAAAWRMAIVHETRGSRSAPLISVLIARIAVGGIPIRLAVLKKRTGIGDGAGSVVIDEAVSGLATIVFVLFGLFFGFFIMPGNAIVRGFLLIAAVSAFGYIVIVTRGRRGFFSCLWSGIPKSLVSPAVRGKFEERDRFLSRFRRDNAAAFYMSLFIHLTVRIFLFLEILAVGRAIDTYFPWALGLGLAAVLPVMRLLLGKIPAALGGLEALVALLFALIFGMPLVPLGIAIPLILRLKTLVWWGIGWGAAGNPAKLLFAR